MADDCLAGLGKVRRLRKIADGLAWGPPVLFSTRHWASPWPASQRSRQCRAEALTSRPTSQPGECGECARRGKGCGVREVWAEVTVMGAEGWYKVWGSSGSDKGNFRGKCCGSSLSDLNQKRRADLYSRCRSRGEQKQGAGPVQAGWAGSLVG